MTAQMLIPPERMASLAEKLAGVGYWWFQEKEDRFVWSEQMYRIYGLDPADGAPDLNALLALYHPDDQRKMNEYRERYHGKEAPEILLRVLRSDGSIRHVLARSSVEFNQQGEMVARYGTVIDVTEMKQAEAAAHESGERYRFIADHVPDMIMRTNISGRPLYISPSSIHVYGYTPEEVMVLNATDMVHPDDLESVVRRIHYLINNRIAQIPEPLRYRARHKDGRWIWVEASLTLIFNADGEPKEVINVVRDISETKKFEAELQDARQRAEAAAAAKAAFLANMSHELRTPLTSIIGFSQLMGARQDLPKEARAYSRRIADASEALLAIINDVLDFSKLDAGEVELESAPLSIARMVDEATGLVSLQAQAKGLTLDTDLDPAVPDNVVGDVARLRQVLINFLSNAVKFTDQGGITVKTDWKDGRIRLSVRDTGQGIAAEAVPLLFERFSQAEVSINRTHGGTGLGLAISKGIIELMGGTIGVDTAPGEGSTFWFEIPVTVADGAARADEAEPVAAGGNLRILLVDDTHVNRELVKVMLEPLGYEIREAPGGAEGVAEAEGARFDLILMDVRMPGVDGLEATRRIRAGSGPNAQTPILALTADVDPAAAKSCHEAGMNDVIAKPIVMAKLLSQIVHWAGGEAIAEAG